SEVDDQALLLSRIAADCRGLQIESITFRYNTYEEPVATVLREAEPPDGHRRAAPVSRTDCIDCGHMDCDHQDGGNCLWHVYHEHEGVVPCACPGFNQSWEVAEEILTDFGDAR